MFFISTNNYYSILFNENHHGKKYEKAMLKDLTRFVLQDIERPTQITKNVRSIIFAPIIYYGKKIR
jgi:hypothetical protein